MPEYVRTHVHPRTRVLGETLVTADEATERDQDVADAHARLSTRLSPRRELALHGITQRHGARDVARQRHARAEANANARTPALARDTRNSRVERVYIIHARPPDQITHKCTTRTQAGQDEANVSKRR